MEEIAREAKLSGKQRALRGADFTITGDVVEFGRKETGDSQLFGILEPLIVLFGSDTALSFAFCVALRRSSTDFTGVLPTPRMISPGLFPPAFDEWRRRGGHVVRGAIDLWTPVTSGGIGATAGSGSST